MDLTTSLDVFPSEAATPAASLPAAVSTPERRPAPAEVAEAAASRGFLKLAWIASLLGGMTAAMIGYIALYVAEGAPQQTAAAAIACLVAVAPYVIARSVQELAR